MLDYYEILEVNLDASQEQIKAQYRFLVQAWHPDKFASAETKAKAEEKLKKINEAYGVLKDAVKREQFDRQRQASREPLDYEYEQQKRALEQAAQEELDRQTQAKHIAEELIRKISAQKAQRESPIYKMRALNVQLAPGAVMEFVRVPAGDFLMGSDTFKDPKARQDEKPQHPVYLAEYLIGQTPVTNRQYLAFLQNTGYQPPAHWQNGAILQLKGALDQAAQFADISMSSASIGVRWDLRENMAIKVQYDRLETPNSSIPGYFSLTHLPFNNTVNLFTVALDFVF